MTLDANETLSGTNADSWSRLSNAAEDANSPLRYLTVCTTGTDQRPKARLMVLRNVCRETWNLVFHTDIRSRKWEELNANPATSIVGFLSMDRIQFRLEGTSVLHAPDSRESQETWNSLPAYTRRTYCGGPPGDYSEDPTSGLPEDLMHQTATEELMEHGQHYFGVVEFQAESLDWTQLSRQGNRRAMHHYDRQNKTVNSFWINP